jgi:regulator of RNase E activity RraA
MPEWKNDNELFDLVRRELYSAVVGDVCDALGLRRQFLPPEIRPVTSTSNVPILVGRAMPVLEADVAREPSATAPFGKMFAALDDLKANEIYLVTGASPTYALFGELMSTAAKMRGAAGAVCDGFIRDTEGIRRLGFPVFARGCYAQDQRGRGTVLDYRLPIEIGGVRIEPGDILVGDIDGVLAVPRSAADEVFRRAIAKARGESQVKAAIERGMPATQAWNTYGVF